MSVSETILEQQIALGSSQPQPTSGLLVSGGSQLPITEEHRTVTSDKNTIIPQSKKESLEASSTVSFICVYFSRIPIMKANLSEGIY